MKLLAVDIGNTNTKAAVFSGGRIRYPGRLEDACRKGIDKVVVASVSPERLKKTLPGLIKKYGNKAVHIIGKDIRVPLRSLYNPRQIGQDRLVTAYAASVLYGTPVLIIDFGTAVTFDVVSKKGVYMGGIIFPGIKMSLESLHKKTALLPKVALRSARGFAARDTKTSISNGIIYGYSYVCRGIVSRMSGQFRGLRIVATGGDAELIGRYAPGFEVVDKDLSLKGIRLLAGPI